MSGTRAVRRSTVTKPSTADEGAYCLSGDGEAARVARSIDWSKTPLGPVASWPASLKTTVAMMLHSRHPMFLWWGPELIQLYNDAYIPSFGRGKHPEAMSQRGRDCWGEIWPAIGPQIEQVMNRGESTWNEDHRLPILRNNRLDEVYWTYGYSPVFNTDGSIGGTLVVCTETTSRVVAERRLRVLDALAENIALASERAELIELATGQLAKAPSDVPFLLWFNPASSAGQYRVAASKHLDATAAKELAAVTERALSEQIVARSFVIDLPASLQVVPENSQWPEPVTRAWVSPIWMHGSATSFVVFGINPRSELNEAYREFFDRIAKHISHGLERIEMIQIRAIADAERNNLLVRAPIATAVLMGPDHVFQLANALYRSVVGREELVGKRYVEAFPELVGTALPGVLDRVYQTGEAFMSEETGLKLDRTGTGVLEDCYFKFNLEPLRTSDQRVYGMIALAIDITDQVRARQTLEKSHSERERMLMELEAASAAKDEFLAMLGHELRNPLSPIVMALEVMKLRAGGQATKEQIVIERQVTHLVRLVDDLLDVARITRGKVELKKERFNLGDVLVEAVDLASDLLEQRKHELKIDVPKEGLTWNGDRVRITQVVSNLLTNAARYTEPGGQVELSARLEDRTIFVVVKDNGIGITAEMLPRVFDLFVQGRRSADRAQGGLGLGLSIVKNLVELHGGAVEVASEGLGKGSTFQIKLPVAPDSAPALAAGSKPADGPSRTQVTQRILVVDDNVDAANSLSDALRAAGHEVTAVYDPLAALKVLAKANPQVAVLDIGLPVIDGYELATRIRELSNCRLIALTGYGQEHDRARSEASGFERFFVKPIQLEKMLTAIEGGPDSSPTLAAASEPAK